MNRWMDPTEYLDEQEERELVEAARRSAEDERLASIEAEFLEAGYFEALYVAYLNNAARLSGGAG